jgi:hypothetical protein
MKTTLPILLAEDLIYKYNKEEIWNLKNNHFNVRFTDEDILMSGRQIIISWYYWEMYRYFPGASLLSTIAVTGLFNKSTHRSLGGKIIWHIFKHVKFTNSATIWDISKAFYIVTNNIYNMSCIELSEYVSSIQLHDLVEILEEESIQKVKEETRSKFRECNYNETVVFKEIKKVYSVTEKLLYTDKNYLASNGIKKMCMAGILNKGQIIQVIGMRGHVNDVDDYCFHYPIEVGYGEGLSTTYDSMIESRSASRASLMNKVPLEQSELLKRKIQLVSMSVLDFDNIPGGCLDYVTIPFLVEPDDYILLKGKYHMVDGVPKLIWDTIDDIVNTIIDLRTITGCGHSDPQLVCSTCLGWSHNIIPPRSNLGFTLATPLCSLLSQNLLSTKHLEGTSLLNVVKLNKHSVKYFKLNSKFPNSIFLNEGCCKDSIVFRINTSYVRFLQQILHVDVSELPPTRITKLLSISIGKRDKEGNLIYPFDEVKFDTAEGSLHLSAEVLDYLKLVGWDSGQGFVDITLNKWNVNTPVIIVSRKSYTMMSFFKEIASFVDPSKETILKITNFKTRGAAISELITLLRKRLNKETGQNFNIVQVEIFIRILMVVDRDVVDHSLPTSKQDFVFAGLKTILLNRTITPMLGFESQYKMLINSVWSERNKENNHPLDYLLHT